jgi:sarcosine oxidase/L-pipecolate oxidase
MITGPHTIPSDLITPMQHPLVDEAPFNRNLHFAIGGSYHSFKFLPIIGDLVTKHLRNETKLPALEARMLKRWRLNRSLEDVAVHPSIVPLVV